MQTDGFSGILTASVEKALSLNDAVEDDGVRTRRTAAARENMEFVLDRMADDEDAQRNTQRTSDWIVGIFVGENWINNYEQFPLSLSLFFFFLSLETRGSGSIRSFVYCIITA